MNNRLIIVMGVSGCGKSTVGQGVAEKMELTFYDGDHFHPKANIDKMASGNPLDDEDRKPWLEAINEFAKEALNVDSIVVACSALKKAYRENLSRDINSIFVYLKGSHALISERLSQREHHFMPSGLLESQFATLEEPADAIVVNIGKSVDEIITEVISNLV